jgi:hypothetical protein
MTDCEAVDGARAAAEEGVWRILGPVLLAVVLAGGGAWLAYVQSQIGAIQKVQAEQSKETSDVKERLRAVEVISESIKGSVEKIHDNARESKDLLLRVREYLEESKGPRK